MKEFNLNDKLLNPIIQSVEVYDNGGKTLLDEFAGLVCGGVFADPSVKKSSKNFAVMAYEQAEEMLKERAKRLKLIAE